MNTAGCFFITATQQSITTDQHPELTGMGPLIHNNWNRSIDHHLLPKKSSQQRAWTTVHQERLGQSTAEATVASCKPRSQYINNCILHTPIHMRLLSHIYHFCLQVCNKHNRTHLVSSASPAQAISRVSAASSLSSTVSIYQ